ncbi:MAG: hypothetical protein ILA24_03840 [Ruminococcus sp.]|nr:hypothetical protein [Ruminococcus sp.]
MAPYIYTYSSLIKGHLSIIYWDRESKNEKFEDATIYRYNEEIDYDSKIGKVSGFFGYRNFIKKILKKNRFDTIILLQTWAALLIGDKLRKEYSNKYIVDIRDYTYENFFAVKKYEQFIFKKAGLCVVSSNGYKSFLPKGKYFTTHNLREISQFDRIRIRNRSKAKAQLNIAFIGVVSYQDQCKKLLLALKNDKRFILSFIGTRAIELQAFCQNNNIKNVRLIDSFDSSTIIDHYNDVDIVNNLYGNNTPILDYALSNKLYFAAEFAMPILVCPSTYMETITNKYGIGITIPKYNRSLGDYIWDSYHKIDWDEFTRSCDKFLSKAKMEQQVFLKRIIKMLD